MLILHAGGVKFNTVIRSKMARSGERLSYDAAMEEVIADACETMLFNSQAVQELAQEKPGLFNTIKGFIDRFCNQILAKHAEAKAIQPIIKDVRKLWDDALKHAVENRESGNTKTAQKKSKKASQKSGAKMSDRDNPYTYERLTSKDPMVVVEFDAQPVPTITKKKGKTGVNAAELSKAALQNADVLENPPAGDMRYVYVDDLGLNVKINREAFAHSTLGFVTNGSTMRAAEVAFAIPDVLRNSVAINELIPRTSEDGTHSYVLFGVALRSDGNAYLVKSTVNHFADNRSILESVEIYDVLKGFKAKMIDAGDLRSHTNKMAASRSTTSTSINVSVADILDFVKNQYSEFLSDSVRDHYGITTPKFSGLRYSERDDARTDRELLMETDAATLSAAEKKALAGYQAKVRDFEERERKVQAALDALDQMVRTGSPDVQKQRSKVTNLQAGMQKALRELTQAEQGKTLLEIIRKEREIQRRRTAYATRETFTRRELRGRITKLYNDLNRRITNPSEKKNIPVPVMMQAVEVLEAINMDSSREGSKAGEKLRNKKHPVVFHWTTGCFLCMTLSMHSYSVV